MFRFYLLYGFCQLPLIEVFALYAHVFQPEAEANVLGLAGVVIAEHLLPAIAFAFQPVHSQLQLQGGVVIIGVKADGTAPLGNPGSG